MIEENLCPVCGVPRRAKRDARRALMQHIRSSCDVAHVMWRTAHYEQHFKHGGDRSHADDPPTEDAVKQAITEAFGEEWSKRVILK